MLARQLAQLCRRAPGGRFASTAVQDERLEKDAKEVSKPTDAEVLAGQSQHLLHEFIGDIKHFGLDELRPKDRPGRAWSEDELRLKSNTDLHKLWYVLLKERNMLLTVQAACEKRGIYFANPERLDKVAESMRNLEEVVHERNDAVLRLEVGDGASPRMRRVTSPIGFTYEKPATEHYEPFEVSGTKEYEVPYLDDDQYITQKLWNEKQHMKKRVQEYDKYWNTEWTEDHETYRRGLRRHFKSVDQLPENVVKRREAEKLQEIEENL